jgi:Tfp pilus assembly protein PilW
MKGALGLIVVCAIVWVFWMTWVAVKRTRKNKND